MKRLLIKVKDKTVILNLRQYGNVEPISVVFNVYSLETENASIDELSKLPGVISVEEEELFDVQHVCIQ